MQLTGFLLNNFIRTFFCADFPSDVTARIRQDIILVIVRIIFWDFMFLDSNISKHIFCVFPLFFLPIFSLFAFSLGDCSLIIMVEWLIWWDTNIAAFMHCGRLIKSLMVFDPTGVY